MEISEWLKKPGTELELNSESFRSVLWVIWLNENAFWQVSLKDLNSRHKFQRFTGYIDSVM